MTHEKQNRALAEFIVANAAEFAPFVFEDVDEIQSTLDDATIIGDQAAGFAVVLPGGKLWLLYVPPDLRGQKRGRLLLREAERVHPDVYLWLKCHKSLRPWYGSKGYRVIDTYGDTREMVGPFKSPQDWADYQYGR